MLRRARVFTPVVVLTAVLVGVSAFAANPRIERAARALQKKAIEEDSLNVDYDSAIDKLQNAVTQCGTSNCSDGLRATLLRDLGAMQVLSGDADGGASSFVAALKLDPSLDLDPRYKNPKLEKVWNGAKKKAGVGVAALTPPPVVDGLVRTPYPIYVEYAGAEEGAKCAVAYKGSAMSDWSKPIALEKHGKGYGAYVPCADAVEGKLQFYVQCASGGAAPAVSAGKRDKPLSAMIKADLAGDPPALPGDEPPKQCAAAAPVEAGCPAGSPGCQLKADGEDCDLDGQCKGGSCTDGKCATPTVAPPPPKAAVGEECDSDDACATSNCVSHACAPPGPYIPRFWVGAWGAIDLLTIGSANNVCKLADDATSPSGYYCVDGSNNDFPADKATNDDIMQATNTDQTPGGPRFPVNVRAGVSVDYAVDTNIMLGLRLGYVFNTYPGQAAPGQNGGERANKFAPIHLEGRFTYVFGKDAVIKPGVAPYAVGAVGVSEFDIGQSVLIQRGFGVGQQQVTAWVIGGPFFFAVGGGARLLVHNFAFLLGARFFGAIGGGTKSLPGIQPELGAQIGF